jgi:hypothetical protein
VIDQKDFFNRQGYFITHMHSLPQKVGDHSMRFSSAKYNFYQGNNLAMLKDL